MRYRLFFLTILFIQPLFAEEKPSIPPSTEVTTAEVAKDPLEISPEELDEALAQHITDVNEFRFIRELAEKLGVRVYLFGGTAASYAHYVRWDLQRKKGDTRFQPDRFEYDYSDIYRSTQDADIVVDGSASDVYAIQHAMMVHFPHLQGEKTAWEVRPLREEMGDKMPILDNKDFLEQNTDSNSVGLIEITKTPEGENRVIDLRARTEKYPPFFEDIRLGKLHFYHSKTHRLTSRARRGDNPEIFSVVRYLIKAFQFGLKISGEDRAVIQEIISRFRPHQDLSTPYSKNWMERNARKLVQNAVDVEYAINTLDELGLRRKLIESSTMGGTYESYMFGDKSYDGSLAYWLSKEPLRSKELGRGYGRTAASIGLDIVAHDTRGLLAYEALTRSHMGNPNAFISRRWGEGETAAFGDGFYTMPGSHGAWGNGLSVRYRVHPDAREGTDFRLLETGAVLFLNRLALEVIPESFQLSAVVYFKMLFGFDNPYERLEAGAQFKAKRKIQSNLGSVKPEEFVEILDLFEKYLSSRRYDEINRNGVRHLVQIAREQPEHLKKLTTILRKLFQQYSKNSRDHLEFLLTDLGMLGNSASEPTLLELVSEAIKNFSDLEMVIDRMKKICSKEGLVKIIDNRLSDLAVAEEDPFRIMDRLTNVLDFLNAKEQKKVFEQMRDSPNKNRYSELLFALQNHYFSSSKVSSSEMDMIRLAIRLARHSGYKPRSIEETLKTVPPDLIEYFADIIFMELKSPTEFFLFVDQLRGYNSKTFSLKKWIGRLPRNSKPLLIASAKDLELLNGKEKDVLEMCRLLGKIQDSGDAILQLIFKIESLEESEEKFKAISDLAEDWVSLKLKQLDAGIVEVSKIRPELLQDNHQLLLNFMRALMKRKKDFGILIRIVGEIFPTESMTPKMFEAVNTSSELGDFLKKYPEFYLSLRLMSERLFSIPISLSEFSQISKTIAGDQSGSKKKLESDEFWQRWGKKSANLDSAQSLIDFMSWTDQPGVWAFHWLEAFLHQNPNLKQIMDFLRTLRDKANTPVESFLAEGSPLFRYIFDERKIHVNAHDLRQLVDLHSDPSSFISRLRHFIRDANFSGIGLASLLAKLEEREWTGALLPSRASEFVPFIRMHPQPAQFLVQVWPELISRDPPNSILIDAFSILDEKQEAQFIGEDGAFEKEFFGRAFFPIDYLRLLRQMKNAELKKEFLKRRLPAFFQRDPNAQEVFDLSQIWSQTGLEAATFTADMARMAPAKSLPGLFERSMLKNEDLAARLQTDPLLELSPGERKKILGLDLEKKKGICARGISEIARLILGR